MSRSDDQDKDKLQQHLVQILPQGSELQDIKTLEAQQPLIKAQKVTLFQSDMLKMVTLLF